MKNIKYIIDPTGRVDLLTKSELLEAINMLEVAANLNTGHKEVMSACRKEGPLFDGDVPSKSHRDDLVKIGAVAKVWANGDQGYNALTYYGGELLRMMETSNE